jgi:hypothetical protein
MRAGQDMGLRDDERLHFRIRAVPGLHLCELIPEDAGCSGRYLSTAVPIGLGRLNVS